MRAARVACPSVLAVDPGPGGQTGEGHLGEDKVDLADEDLGLHPTSGLSIIHIQFEDSFLLLGKSSTTE